MGDTFKEKFINSYPEPIQLEGCEKIIEQMKNCICRIYNGCEGTGFFAKIPYKSTFIHALITNNHIINENDIINNKTIIIYINKNKGKKKIILKINEKRKRYTNEKLDITIIELKEEDNIQNFIEIDDNIIESLNLEKQEISEQLKILYSNKSIYILNYPEDNNIAVSYGGPPNIVDETINHKCITKEGSSGSPILLSSTQKLIGVHYGSSKQLKFNKGSLIIYSIIEFNQIDNNLLIIKDGTLVKKQSIIYIKNDDKKNEIQEQNFLLNNNIDKLTDIINSTCLIGYINKNNNSKGLGFLIQLKLNNSINIIKGILTTQNILGEDILNYNKHLIVSFKKYKKPIFINPKEHFIFSSSFLNITFIEYDNSKLTYLEINENINLDEILYKEVCIPNIYNEKDSPFIKGKVRNNWGFNIYHTISTDYNLFGSPLILLENCTIIGIHKESYPNLMNLCTNIFTVIQAIKIFKYYKIENPFLMSKPRTLKKEEIKELEEHRLISTENPLIFMSKSSKTITPLMFIRTNHAWYWTPEVGNEYIHPNWLIIYPKGSLKVIGGYWDGIEHANKNIHLIHWLEKTGLKYLV